MEPSKKDSSDKPEDINDLDYEEAQALFEVSKNPIPNIGRKRKR